MEWEALQPFRWVRPLDLFSRRKREKRTRSERKRERERQVEWKSFNQLSILLALPDTWRYAIHRGTAAAAHLSNTHTGPNVWVRWEVLEAWTIQCRLQFLFLSCTHMGAVGGTIDGGILHSPPRVASVPFTKRGRERERGGIRFKSLAWPILFPIRTTHRTRWIQTRKDKPVAFYCWAL